MLEKVEKLKHVRSGVRVIPRNSVLKCFSLKHMHNVYNLQSYVINTCQVSHPLLDMLISVNLKQFCSGFLNLNFVSATVSQSITDCKSNLVLKLVCDHWVLLAKHISTISFVCKHYTMVMFGHAWKADPLVDEDF